MSQSRIDTSPLIVLKLFFFLHEDSSIRTKTIFVIVFHFLMKRDENPFFTRKVCVRLKRCEQISLVRLNQE